MSIHNSPSVPTPAVLDMTGNLERVARHALEAHDINRAEALDAIGMLALWNVGNHLRVQERHLFPDLLRMNPGKGVAIEGLLMDHLQIRALLSEAADQLHGTVRSARMDADTLARLLLVLANLIKHHIEEENRLLAGTFLLPAAGTRSASLRNRHLH